MSSVNLNYITFKIFFNMYYFPGILANYSVFKIKNPLSGVLVCACMFIYSHSFRSGKWIITILSQGFWLIYDGQHWWLGM
jgi:hypothetical protein